MNIKTGKAELHTYILLTLITTILFLPVIAKGESEAKRSLRYGLMVGTSSMKVDDPDGKTASTTEFSFPNVLLVSDLTRDKRLFINMFGQSGTLDASSTEIGQDITRIGATGMLQFAFFDKAVWLGAGLGVVQEKFESRHRVDDQGFLIPGSELKDRTEIAVPFLVGVSTQYSINRDLDIGLHLQYEAPLRGDINVLSAYAYLLY